MDKYFNHNNIAGFIPILTKQGIRPVQDFENKTVECWNGNKWVPVKIVNTSVSKNLIELTFSNNSRIVCSPNTGFDINIRYNRKKIIKSIAKNMKIGTKIDKWDFTSTCDHGDNELHLAYENGFFTADGCETRDHKRIILYDKKMDLLQHFRDYDRITHQSNRQTRINLMYSHRFNRLKEKFFVPDNSYSIKSRLEWFEGLMDGDGYVGLTLKKTTSSQYSSLVSINKNFLIQLRYMLLEMGIHVRLYLRFRAGHHLMPTHNPDNPYKEYWCKEVWAITIPGSQLQKLCLLGFKPKRLKIMENKIYTKQSIEYVRVVQIKRLYKPIKTYRAIGDDAEQLVFDGVMVYQNS